MADENKGPRLKKDGTPFAKRGESAAAKRPAYLVFSINDANGTPIEGAVLVVHDVTRKADDVLAATSGQTTKKYQRIEV